jgi:hypothetical protein
VALTPASSSGSSSGGSGILVSGSRSTDLSTAAVSFGTGADVLASPLTFAADGTSSYAVFIFGPGQTNNFAGGGKQNELALVLDGAQSVFVSFIGTAATSQPISLAGMGIIATPALGNHTVNVRFWVSGGTGTLFASGSLANSNILVYVTKLV